MNFEIWKCFAKNAVRSGGAGGSMRVHILEAPPDLRHFEAL